MVPSHYGLKPPGPRWGNGRAVMGVEGWGADSIYLSLHSSLSLTDLTFLTRSARCSHKNLRSTRQPMVPAPANLEPSIRCLTSCILCDLLEEGVGSKNCGSPTSLHEATAPATHAPQELAARGFDLLHDPSQKATHRGDEPPANRDQKTSNNIIYPSASGMHG